MQIKDAPVIYDKLIQTNQRTVEGPTVEEYVYCASPQWKSSNENVAVVDKNGNVRARRKGKAKIQVKYNIWISNSKLRFEKDGEKIKSMYFPVNKKWGDFPGEQRSWRDINDIARKYSVVRNCTVTVK